MRLNIIRASGPLLLGRGEQPTVPPYAGSRLRLYNAVEKVQAATQKLGSEVSFW